MCVGPSKLCQCAHNHHAHAREHMHLPLVCLGVRACVRACGQAYTCRMLLRYRTSARMRGAEVCARTVLCACLRAIVCACMIACVRVRAHELPVRTNALHLKTVHGGGPRRTGSQAW